MKWSLLIIPLFLFVADQLFISKMMASFVIQNKKQQQQLQKRSTREIRGIYISVRASGRMEVQKDKRRPSARNGGSEVTAKRFNILVAEINIINSRRGGATEAAAPQKKEE